MGVLNRFKAAVRAFRRPEQQRTYDPSTYFRTMGDGWLIPPLAFSDSDLDRLITASTWCYAALVGNARTMAALPPVVQVRDDKGKWITERGAHPLWKFLDDPLGPDKAYPWWSWQELMELTFIHRPAVGNAWWRPAIVNGGKEIHAVYPLMAPGSVTADEDRVTKAPRRYRYLGQEWPADGLVNFRNLGTGSFWKGLSSIKAALAPISTDTYAAARQDASMRNRAGLGVIVGVPGVLGLSGEQRDEIYKELEESYQEAEQEGTPWVVADDIKVAHPPTAVELQVFDTRNAMRDQVLAVVGMPPPVAGVYDRAILNNFKQANVVWWIHYLFPALNSVYRALNAQLIRRVHGPNVRVWYNLAEGDSDIANQLFDLRVDTGLKLSKLGYCTNAICDRMGLEMPHEDYLDWPNTQLVQAGRIELDDLKEMIEATRTRRKSGSTLEAQ